MIVEPLRLLVDWATDPAAGVNAELPGVPRPAGQLAPGAVTILNELDDIWVARGEPNRDAIRGRRILAFSHFDADAQGFPAPVLPEQEGAVVHVAATYLALGVPATLALWEARQTLRALHRVVARRFDSMHTAHERLDTVVSAPPQVRYLPGFGTVGDTQDVYSLATLVVSLPILDRWALGIT